MLEKDGLYFLPLINPKPMMLAASSIEESSIEESVEEMSSTLVS